MQPLGEIDEIYLSEEVCDEGNGAKYKIIIISWSFEAFFQNNILVIMLFNRPNVFCLFCDDNTFSF